MEVVLKCDSIGSLEAVTSAISEIASPSVDIRIIHSGVGMITKSDVIMAETASRLILGFQVGAMPRLEKDLMEHHVEARLYNVIYSLSEDVKAIAEGMVPSVPEEQVIGSAAVIALFKSTRKGIIIGCEVRSGFLSVGQHFRIISAMGPVFAGVIESIHLGNAVIQRANQGQQVGIKIRNFNKVKKGDFVESFRILPPSHPRPWEPKGGVIPR